MLSALCKTPQPLCIGNGVLKILHLIVDKCSRKILKVTDSVTLDTATRTVIHYWQFSPALFQKCFVKLVSRQSVSSLCQFMSSIYNSLVGHFFHNFWLFICYIFYLNCIITHRHMHSQIFVFVYSYSVWALLSSRFMLQFILLDILKF